MHTHLLANRLSRWLAAAACSLLALASARAQNLVNETFEGANSFTVVNGTQTNKWFVGTAATNGPTTAGTQAAYIDNGTGATNAYTITTTSVVHMYQDVAIPAGQTVNALSFDWKGQGESSYDYLQVFVVPTSTMPVAGTLPTTTLCAGAGTTLTLGTVATAGTFSSTPGLSINATTGAVNPATSTAGTYVVTNTVAASGGCAAATSTATVTINALPTTPTYTYTYPTPSTVLFNSSVAPAGTTYQWYLNGVAIAGATSPTYTANGATAPGTYTVRFNSTATGCQSAASTPLTVTATLPTLAGSSLQLFPNPTTTGLLTLQLNGYTKAVQLTVLDALGRVVLKQKVAAGQVQTQLDLSGTATGVYLLRATTEGGTEVRRIVRE